MQLSIVIVTYNSDNYIIPCLQSIYKNSSSVLQHEIIVVDNNSKNKIDFKSYSNVKLIQNNENHGYSKALNIGVENSSGLFILALNPDVIFKNDVIDILISVFSLDFFDFLVLVLVLVSVLAFVFLLSLLFFFGIIIKL